jgi:ABC-2 type transport system permease protein
MMNKTLLVMWHEIRATLRRKTFLIFALGLPLLLAVVALIFMAVNRNPASPAGALPGLGGVGDEAQVAEGYVDEGDLIHTLPNDIPSGWLTAYPDEAAAQAALGAGQIDGYYLIPADYLRSGEITYVRRDFDLFSDDGRPQRLEWILVYNLAGDPDLAARVWDPLDVTVTELAPAGPDAVEDSWFTSLLPTMMALILYMAILLPSSTLISALTDEKKNRVMEVLISSMSSRQMITGKVLALALLGLLQLSLWVGLLAMVGRLGGRPLGIPPGTEVPTGLLVWAFIYGLLGYAIYGAQMAGVGALAPDVKDSRSVSFVVMAPLIVVYMFMTAIVMRPDGPFALFMSLFPLTSPVGMIARMTQTEVPLWQAVLAAVLQLLTAVVIVRLVARLFRAQYLLSGQAFSVGSFYRALLGRV